MRAHACPKPRRKHAEPCRACYVICRCRCDGCRAAKSEAERFRIRQTAYGRWQPYVDAEPVREHVRSLMASKIGGLDGLGLKQISRLTGIGGGTLCKLMYGQQGHPPSKRVRPETAEKILALHPGLVANGATVPAGETWRRVREMLAGGFCKAELGRLITENPEAVSLQIGKRRVLARTHRRVGQLYARWQRGELEPEGKRSRWNAEHERSDAA